jgi:hypothetical protein
MRKCGSVLFAAALIPPFAQIAHAEIGEAGRWDARPRLPLNVTGAQWHRYPVGAVLKEAARDAVS